MSTVFVFGSNLAGRHSAGSALEARRNHGAQVGVGQGPTGNAYAIPTKNHNLHTMTLSQIACYVDNFILYAIQHPSTRFEVVDIGCGLAGYQASDIAPLFTSAPSNVHFLGDLDKLVKR